MSDRIDAFNTSDEATGLPPLGEDADATVLMLRGGTSAGMVMLPNTDEGAVEPLEVIYLHIRGLLSDSPDGRIDWVQTTVAIPKQILPTLLEQLQAAAPEEA